MGKKKVLDAVKFFKKCLEERRVNVSSVFLFGSQMKGDAGPESDIDLMIVSKDFEGKNIFQRTELTRDAEIRTIRKFLVPLDVIDVTPAELDDRSSFAGSLAEDRIEV